MFKKEWVHKKLNLSLNMKFGQFIKSVGILQFQTVLKVYFYVLTMLSDPIINK